MAAVSACRICRMVRAISSRSAVTCASLLANCAAIERWAVQLPKLNASAAKEKMRPAYEIERRTDTGRLRIRYRGRGPISGATAPHLFQVRQLNHPGSTPGLTALRNAGDTSGSRTVSL